jgi:hypothetical protein
MFAKPMAFKCSEKENKKRREYPYSSKFYPCISHLRGMSWYVPFGSVLLIVRGSIPESSSKSAMSIGPARASGTSIIMGAPMAICSALAPTIRALSNRVILAGPIETSVSSFFILVLSCAWGHSHSSHSAHSTTAWRHWRSFHFS